ncbi:TniQ family protein [Saccharophagus degradans]|uniref:TniQ family protein n=1 Tax=Saccharophagus degradans TaxID=86304 RepID=UPI000313B82F|nr:TniQ family protein [Saccharophagus degradans]
MVSKPTNKLFPSYWPYPLTPKSDELLSSWLARNSFYTGVNPYRFCERLLPSTPIWDRDIDRYTPAKLNEKLSIYSGESIETIESMTFRKMQKNVPSNWLDVEAITPMILSIGIHGRSRNNFGLQYCPYCLGENPYFRKHWRFAFYTYCDRHSFQLLDACQYCEEKIIPHKSERVDLCWSCNRSLSLIRPNDTNFLSLRRNQLLTVSSEGVVGCNLSIDFSTTNFLRNIRNLIKVIVEVDGGELTSSLKGKKLQYELLRVDARRKITKILEEVMAEWPVSFHKYMVGNNVTQRKFERSVFDEFIMREIDKLPVGRKVYRAYNPVVYTQELRNLKRRSKSQYRVDRANLLLKDCNGG